MLYIQLQGLVEAQEQVVRQDPQEQVVRQDPQEQVVRQELQVHRVFRELLEQVSLDLQEQEVLTQL